MNDNTEIIKASRKKTKPGHQVEISAWDSLNDRQRVFVLEYIRTMNGSASYRAAYPLAKANAARAAAARLLTKSNISGAIQERLDTLWASREALCGRTLAEIQAIAFSDIFDIINFSNGNINLHNLSEVDTRAVKSLRHKTSVSGSESFSVVMYDKIAALALLVKILGMVQEDVGHTETITVVPARDPQELLDEDEQRIP
ncbi:MAG: terminase small subunit [Spirochaetes bacterium]|nr:terminase small subunit [Spirochaetota bacterium]